MGKFELEDVKKMESHMSKEERKWLYLSLVFLFYSLSKNKFNSDLSTWAKKNDIDKLELVVYVKLHGLKTICHAWGHLISRFNGFNQQRVVEVRIKTFVRVKEATNDMFGSQERGKRPYPLIFFLFFFRSSFLRWSFATSPYNSFSKKTDQRVEVVSPP